MWPAPPAATSADFHTCTHVRKSGARAHPHRPDEQVIMSLACALSRQWLICQHPSRYLCSWLAARLVENHFVSSAIAWLSHHLPTNTDSQQILPPNDKWQWSWILMNVWLHIVASLLSPSLIFKVQANLKFMHEAGFPPSRHLGLCLSVLH